MLEKRTLKKVISTVKAGASQGICWLGKKLRERCAKGEEAFIFFQTTFAFTIQEDRIIRGYVYSTFEIILLTGVERIFPGSPVG